MAAPYLRLAAALRQRITTGEWPPGTRIPSVRNLEAEYGVGHTVASRAVALLHVEGLLEGKPRARLRVADPAPAPRTLIRPDADWPYGRGDKPVISRIRATEELAVRLRLPTGAQLTRSVVDLLDPDNRPAMLLTTWQRGTRPRPHVDYRCMVTPHHEMTPAEAAHLGLAAGTLAAVVERTRYDVDGHPVETADLVLPSDRWRMAWSSCR